MGSAVNEDGGEDLVGELDDGGLGLVLEVGVEDGRGDEDAGGGGFFGLGFGASHDEGVRGRLAVRSQLF